MVIAFDEGLSRKNRDSGDGQCYLPQFEVCEQARGLLREVSATYRGDPRFG